MGNGPRHGTRLRRTRSIAARSLAASMALAALVSIRPAHSEPGDIFTISAPAITDQPPAAADIMVGDASVATQTGQLGYGFAVKVPPGRQGLQPSISLAYSSQSPIYGGAASGWALAGLPIISEDTSRGRIAGPTRLYTSSLSGGRPLIEVSELGQGAARYRAANDGSWLRYERHTDQPFHWRAYAPDGMTYYFGHHGAGDNHTTGCTIISDGYAPLTATEDAFGNRIDYTWRPGVDGECRIEAITWGHSANPNVGVGYFAAIEFDYTIVAQPCEHVGSQTSYRTGVKIVTGASRLDAIRVAAFAPIATDAVTPDPIPASPDHTRTITLTYSSPTADCPNPARHAALRELLAIQESAVGVDSPPVTLPAVTFQYGDASLEWDSNSNSSLVQAPWLAAFEDNDAYNLGWGYRFRTGNGWPTVEATMVDVDGDGRLDRLTNAPYYADGGVKFCRARWERNLGRDASGVLRFASNPLDPDLKKRPRYIELPTLKWATDTLNPPYAGGARARIDPNRGSFEQCALNYQRTGYVNSSSNVVCQPEGTTGSCPATNYCSYGTDCVAKTTPVGNTVFAWRWFDVNGDGKTDLIGSPIQGGVHSYNLYWGTGVAGWDPLVPQEPAIFGDWPACPSTTYTADPNDTPNRPYTMCNGMFPWLVFLNHGGGSFGVPRPFEPIFNGGVPEPPSHATWGPLPDQILYQPIPLETTAGDSSITAAPVGETQGTLDLDGDGYADAVYRPPYDGPTAWSLYLNDRTGRFAPYSQGASFQFTTGPNYKLAKTTGIPAPKSIEGMFDFTGDGMVDHWIAGCADCVAHAAMNDGVHLRMPGGAPELSTKKPGANSWSYDVVYSGSFIESGWRIDSSSVVDVDVDGRPDIAEFPPASNGIFAPKIYFNQGGTFAGNEEIRYDLASTNRILGKKDWIGDYMGGSTSYTWETRNGIVDLDGDGIAEAVAFANETTNPPRMWSTRIPTPAQPPRLLASINNGRGAVTTVTYSSMHGAAVQYSDPYKAMPRSEWVVHSVSVDDLLANTTTTRSYSYKNPRYHADEQGRYGFRGFDEVTTTRPTGAATVETFSYTPDWSGRLQKTLVVPAPSEQTVTGEVRSIDETTWEQRVLFGGALKTYHATITDQWTCKTGQDELACRENTDTRTRTVAQLCALPSTTGPDFLTPLLWQETAVRLMSGESWPVSTQCSDSPSGDVIGTRRTTTTFALAADATTYRLRPTGTTKDELQLAGYAIYAKSATVWDGSYRVETDEDVWFGSPELACTATAAHCARTHRVFDMDTGNVLERIKPSQWAAGGTAKAIYTFDARKLFVATETNEAGMQLDFGYEYGTGTKLLTAGPNVGSCSLNPSTCPVGTTIKEERRTRVDGVGRMIERWEPSSPQSGNVSSYTPVLVETNTYEDTMPTPTTPTSVTHTGFVTSSATDSQDVTELDGHGRPLKKTVLVFGTAPANQVTSFVYNHDGSLAEVRVPDPMQNDASTVTYRYVFDSLGRPTSLRRPDAPNLSDQSGVNISYDGLVTTTAEVVGAAGGQPASTRTTNDPFGRLVTVEERLTTSPEAWATTTYHYDPNDQVTQIVGPAPDEVTTTLSHDLAGRRTAITRQGRTWRYGYDKNGNVASEQAPCSPAPFCEAAYTTTIVYDALDRPSSKYVAPRDMEPGDIALFGLHHEKFVWDYGVLGHTGNFKGRLIYWRAFAAASESGTLVYNSQRVYQAQGQRTETSDSFLGAGLSLLRRHLRAFNVTGRHTFTHYQDYLNSTSNATTATIAYDRRGLPYQLSLTPGGAGGNRVVATQTRNVAGLVTKRYAPGIGGPMTFVESNWSYDSLGRVVSQVVQKGPGPTRVAQQDLSYWGNDDPKSLDHWLGPTNQKHFNFTYDLRHQLLGVDETLLPNAFDATYEYGPPGTPNGSGRFTRARHEAAALPGSDVAERDVLYQYDGDDPEQVTALVDASNPMVVLASYAYDLAGNQTIRCNGALTGDQCSGESVHYLYDGANQLRRATKKAAGGGVLGSEEYWYDAEGSRTVTVKRDALGNKTGVIFWIVDVEAHYDGAGVLERIYTHPSLGTPVVRTVRTGATSVAIDFQYHGLANNLLASVANYWGTINASFVYAPFGEIIEATDAGAPTNGIAQHRRRFNDKFVDELSDLAYYGFRYYDKLSMTWTQSDPLYRFAPDFAKHGSPRRANLYAFSLQNPLRYLDPDGRDSTTCKEGGGGCTTTESVTDRSEAAVDAEAPAPAADETVLDPGTSNSGAQTGDLALPIAIGAAVGGIPGVIVGAVLGVAVSGMPSPTQVATSCVVGAGCAKACSGCSKTAGKSTKTLPSSGGATTQTQKALPAPKSRGNANRVGEQGTFYADPKGNVISTPPGGRVTGSPDGRFIQARDAAGNPTGVRIDGPHKASSHPDPRAQQPHGHVPGVTNPDGTPWLPIK